MEEEALKEVPVFIDGRRASRSQVPVPSSRVCVCVRAHACVHACVRIYMVCMTTYFVCIQWKYARVRLEPLGCLDPARAYSLPPPCCILLIELGRAGAEPSLARFWMLKPGRAVIEAGAWEGSNGG